MNYPPPESYRAQWRRWGEDPLLESHGLTFDRTPAGVIRAPEGRVRVCAWHVDFDERPTLWLDVGTVEEAAHVCSQFRAACGANVDFATAHDSRGEEVARTS